MVYIEIGAGITVTVIEMFTIEVDRHKCRQSFSSRYTRRSPLKGGRLSRVSSRVRSSRQEYVGVKG